MKAKEYALEFIKAAERSCTDNGFNAEIIMDSYNKIRLDLLKEYPVIMKSRNAFSNSASINVLKELRDKWKSICKHVLNKSPEHTVFKILFTDNAFDDSLYLAVDADVYQWYKNNII